MNDIDHLAAVQFLTENLWSWTSLTHKTHSHIVLCNASLRLHNKLNPWRPCLVIPRGHLSMSRQVRAKSDLWRGFQWLLFVLRSGKCWGHVDTLSSVSCPSASSWEWSARVLGRVACVKWHLHECQEPGFPNRLLLCSKMINVIYINWF